MFVINDAFWAEKKACAAALRQLLENVQTRELSASQLHQLTASVNDMNETLEQVPQKLAQMNWAKDWEGHNMLDVQLLMSPVSGQANPIAPPLHINIDDEDEVVRAEVNMGWQYEGPPGCVHGGFIAALFDEMLGLTQLKAKNPGMTGELKVRYQRPTPLAETLTFEAQVERAEGRKTFVTAVLKHQDTVTASCEALFIRPKQSPTKTLREKQSL